MAGSPPRSGAGAVGGAGEIYTCRDDPANLGSLSCGDGIYGAGVDERQLRKKHDKELIELLNELRVALPGAQVLFAFLLVVPFSSRFDVDRIEKIAYMVALLATLLGTILLIAPSSYHRLRWREKNKERMLRTSNWLAIGGLASLAVAMTASLFLVTDVLLPRSGATVVTVAAAVSFTLAWFALPLSQPYDRWDDDEDDENDLPGDE
jgi:uncharacterized protein DUF6328